MCSLNLLYRLNNLILFENAQDKKNQQKTINKHPHDRIY
jgi:hypothetical protein